MTALLSASGVAVRAAVLGTAVGGRSMSGVAAVATSSGPRDRAAGAPLRLLAARYAPAVTTALLLGELVADKLPGTPSRLAPPALAGRLAFGVLAGGALAQRSRVPPAVPAVLGGLLAVAGSVAGARFRRAAAARGVPDLYAALAEDAVVLTMARWATAA